MKRKKMSILAMAVAHACYVIGHEYDTKRQREAVWGQIRRA